MPKKDEKRERESRKFFYVNGEQGKKVKQKE